MYMETSPSANSSALGTVTLKDTFTQLTWGSLGVERTGEAYTKLKELSGNLANVEITTHVTAKDGEKTETYEVTENFTMKWASQRIYMMDYERTMTELFTGDSDLFSGKRIILGIGNGDGVHAVKECWGPVHSVCDRPGAVGIRQWRECWSQSVRLRRRGIRRYP